MNDNMYTKRFENIFAKGMCGKTIRIVFLGGSVTKGSLNDKRLNYVNMFKDHLNEYIDKNISFEIFNLGEPAANSMNGRIRIEKEVINLDPDIVFLDFSVNDSSQNYLAESFEGIVRRLLLLSNDLVVCPIILCNHVRQSTGGMISWVAEHYGIPVIDIASEVCKAIDERRMQWEDYACDYVHPTYRGYKLIADKLLLFIKKVCTDTVRLKQEFQVGIPASCCFSGMYNELKLINWQDAVSLSEEENVGDVIFHKELTFKALVIEYIQNSVWNEASVVVEIDGECVKLLDAFSSVAWGNAVSCPVYRSNELKKHIINIKIGNKKTIENFSFTNFISSIGIS